MIATNGAVATVIGPAQARLQADIARFLGLKQVLYAAQRRAQTPEQAAALARLLATQEELERRLPAALAAAQRLTAGSIDMNDALLAGQFYAEMEAHLANAEATVGALPAPAGGAALVAGINWPRLLLWGGAIAGGVYVIRTSASGIVWVGLGVGAYLLWRNRAAMLQPAPAGQ